MTIPERCQRSVSLAPCEFGRVGVADQALGAGGPGRRGALGRAVTITRSGLRCAPRPVSRRRSRSVPRLRRRSFGRAASRAFGVAGDSAALPAREVARAPCGRISGGAARAAMVARLRPLPCRPGLGGLCRSILVSRLLGTGTGSNPRLATAAGGAEPRTGP